MSAVTTSESHVVFLSVFPTYLAVYKNIGYRPVDIIIIKKSTNEFSAICIGLL